MPTDPLLSAASDDALATGVQDNLFALFRAMATLPPLNSTAGSALVETDALCCHDCFPQTRMFKGAWRTRLHEGDADATIQRTIAWFRSRGAPHFYWWTGPGSAPADLPQRLQAQGLVCNIAGDPGMAGDLHALHEDLPVPREMRIVQAVTPEALDDWAATFSAANASPAWNGGGWVEATRRWGVDKAPWQLYVAYLNGAPVATSLCFPGAGVVGIYGVGTLPEARGRGIGGAVTLRALVEGRARGYRYGVLYATALGYRAYQRLGLHEVPCRIGRYLWQDKPAG